MASRRLLLLALLLFSYGLVGSSWNYRREIDTFQFTAPVYNVSLEENARGKDIYAIVNEPIRMGVALPSDDAILKFRIVEGDRQYFKAEVKTVGDFAFLRIRYRNDGILNRELKERYEFLIKASCRRKDATNLETTVMVNLFVRDQNDARPIFEKDEYRTEVKQNVSPFTTILQVQASDADVALNSQIYYSLVEWSLDFMVDPISGAIRNLRPLESGTYELTVLAEDRASRLFRKKAHSDDGNNLFNHNKAKAVIKVEPVEKNERKLSVEVKPISASLWNVTQTVAIARIEGVAANIVAKLEIVDGEYAGAFVLKKDSSSANVWLVETIAGIWPQADWFIQLKATTIDGFVENLMENISVQLKGKQLVQYDDNLGVMQIVVNESVPLGYVLTQLKAHVVNGIDGDDEQIRYSISNTDKPFSVDEKNGYLRVIKWLDYENVSFYRFEVSARLLDSALEAKKEVEVIVADSNDHCPTFAVKWTRGDPIAFPRNYPINKVLFKAEALDIDSGANGHIRYELIGETVTIMRIFTVIPDSGEVVLQQKPPDNESQWNLRIRASDAGWPFPRSNEVLISMYVSGTNAPPKRKPSFLRKLQNEHSPVFMKQTVFVVSVDTPPGKVVGQIESHDDDMGYAGLIRFGTFDKFFALEPFTGEVILLVPLGELLRNKNKKKQMEYIFEITACDWGQPVRCTNGTVTVLITEANVYRPRFEKPYYRVHIAEDTAIGTKFLAVLAQDNDYGDKGQVGYQIIDSQNHFQIDENTGILQVMKKLDREEMAFHRLTIMAFDHGHPMKATFVNVTVVLTDINDNAPLCAEPIRKIIIPEDYPNNALLTCVAAWDPDEGKNGEVVYTFDITVETSLTLPFRIEENTGCIFVNTDEPFDFETINRYNLSVEAMDNGEPMLSSICTVLVEFSDVNENLFPPLFDDIAREATVYENMPLWTEVLALKAIDPDSPEMPVKYTLIDGDGISSFIIDSEGILRTSVVLDREAYDSYWLTIEACDMNPVPLCSVLHVFVRVLDRNDHIPLSLRPIYFSTIPENSPEDTVITKVEAEDKDDFLDRHDITNIRFKIISGDPQSFFGIDSKTGYIITRGKRRLDRETQKEHVIVVEICDQGYPKLCTTVSVVITITDLNDNLPSFKQTTYNFNVPADEIGELCRIFAMDIDEGQNARLLYNFTEADPRFCIDSDGQIITTDSLKENENYQLTVKASDMGQPLQTSSPVLVTLNAIRRHTKKTANGKPKLLNENRWTRLSISDADSIGETIGLIEAEDPDGDQLWWKIIGGNPNNTFAISCDAGELYLAKSLDFIRKNITIVRLKFAVNDGLDTTEGVVLIEIFRKHRPEFDAQYHKILVPKTAPIGTVVHTLKATIEQLNGSISDRGIIFGIHVVEDIAVTDKLRVNPSSGEVVIAEPLNNIVTNFFTMVVYARFNQMINYAQLDISLRGETKTPPKFIVSEYFTTISASSPVGTPVLTVRAYDPDHSSIQYSIIEGNEDGHFAISEYSGEIRTSQLISYNHERTTLVVQASIQKNSSLTDRCSVRINILNDDLGRVNFPQSSYSLTVHESTPPNTIVYILKTNSVMSIRYSFRDPCPFLSVHPISGVIFTKLVTNSASIHHTCIAIARNSLGTEDFMELKISVVSENQYAPYFSSTVYQGYIHENMPLNSSVLLEDGRQLLVKAIDHDKGINGLVTYCIVSPLEPYFTIDYISGAILTKREIDFEKVKHWSFYVQASDSAPQVLTSPVPALVEIVVLDMNDEPPSFIQEYYNATLFLPTLKNTTVCYVTAIDVDTVGVLRYAIIASDDSKLFAIEEFTGRVYTNGNSSADYAKSKYEINLVVSDGLKSDSTALLVRTENTSETGSTIKFLATNYEAVITENMTSSVMVQLLTVCAISTVNGSLLYNILNPSSYFIVGVTSGIISWTGTAIDREKMPVVKLIVQARLSNGANERAQSIVTIKVEDKNDCEPRFIGLPYELTIPRDIKLADKVTNVKAVDADEGFNGAVRYKLKTSTEYFDINKYDGRIVISRSLEVANFDSVSLEVIAEDQGEPSLSSSAHVVIHIADRNIPMFGNRYQEAHILESAAPGTSIINVHAASIVGGRIGYAIKSGNDENRFRIDFDTGMISVHKPLDREKCAFYNLTVVAIDVIRLGVRAESYVVVNVDDISDTPPHFTQLFYSISVSESAVIGTQLLKIEAIDPDIGDNHISYGIIGPNASVLSVDPQSGAVSLMKSLDFETMRLFKFKLTASDSMQLTSKTDLLLHVTDANDVAPRFVSKTFNSVVESETPINHFITKLDASDEDIISNLEDGKRFLFSIIDGDVTLLQINQSTGVVSLLRAVAEDDLKIGKKHFNVSVSDGIFTDFCLLTVKIVRSSSEHQLPRFERMHYSTAVQENGPIGMTVMTVQAHNGIPPLRYSFNGCHENCSGILNIDETTGKVYTRNLFDYEAQSVHQFVIMVTDAGDRCAFATLTLDVIDENDNIPQFITSNIATSVPVNSRPGESVLMVFAFDYDVDDELEYSIVDSDEICSKYFTIHPKQGLISVKEPLNDLVGEQISLFVRVTDSADPPHQSEISVILNVSPIVHLPKFSTHHFLFSVSEDVPIGTVVGRLQQDSQFELPDVSFSLVSMDNLSDFPFSVKQESGQIVVNSVLDYEKIREIRFLVSLHSQRQFNAKAVSLVTVRITDVNDNKPRFEITSERVVISEDLPIGSSITIIRAVDEDAVGLNSKVQYFLEEDNNSSTFKLDQETGWLSLLKEVDREVMEEYGLTVNARDGGGQSTRKKITVILKDVNDSPPQFSQEIYFIEQYMEDLRVGQNVLQLQVHDLDLYPNNVTSLYIIRGNEHGIFGLEMNSLVLHKLPTDSHSLESHLLILAHDGKYTAKAEVMVKLLSNFSQFQCEPKEILRNITEDSPTGTIIKMGYQKVRKSLRFYLTGSESNLFAVENNGTVVVRDQLSSHISNQVELFLWVETPESLCIQRIVVKIERTSKGRVTFKQPVFYGMVRENSNATREEKVFATRLEAAIDDLDGIGHVTFKFANNSNQYLDLFDINSETGVIAAISSLDREVKDQYDFSVLAISAAGNSAEAKVIIDVGDVNDNAPVFEQDIYHLRIAEDEALGKELLQLKAYGGDDKEVIIYQMQASDDVAKYLSIDANSGLLKLASLLDFETLEKFMVTVIATDSGKPPLSSTCEIDVEILDINDNPPRFMQHIYRATVLENMQRGTKVVQVLANDPDSEHFGRVSYLITNDAVGFTIGEDGWITTTEMLDREVKSTYRLTVKAVDGGTPPLSDSIIVEIEVEDENDNAPVFKHCNMTAVVQESVEPGHVILPISITDNDKEPNTGPYRLEIIGDSASLFAFDRNLNLITTKRLPPHAKKEVYLLSVKVSDRDNLSTECPMTLFVKEESRHAPQSNPLKITLNTLMGEFLGGIVGKIMATDEDSTDMLRYSLADREANANSIWSNHQHSKIPFSVDSETGDIIGEADLLAGTYRFNVSVTDGKYIAMVPVVIDVISIDQDALDHSVSVRIHNLLGETFFNKHVTNFMHSLSRFLNVKPQNVRILSVQSTLVRHHLLARQLNNRTTSEQDLDILFTVSRADSRGYHRPNFIRQRLEDNVAQLSDDIGREIISIITETCRRDICANGECRDRLYLDDAHSICYKTDHQSFSAPVHLRTYDCTCRTGYAGKRCDIPVDKCSRDQCSKEEICVPMNTDIGFDCICPPGTTGDRCDATVCGKDRRECSQDAEIGVGGDGFFQMTVANSVERRLELTIHFRTTSADAVIMYGAGNSDFHTIEVERRYVQYRWNCGTGPGVVRINQQTVSDGKWHSLKVSRRSRHAKLVLDGLYEKEGDSPQGSDVVNLYRQDIRLTFGAMVTQSVDDSTFIAASDLKPVVTKGMIGCFGRISVDGYEVPKTKQSLYLYNTRLNCNTIVSAPCAASPCKNEGTCIPSSEKAYDCVCPPRYSGSNCEIDLTPCVSRPCPRGVECINLHNDFYCSCPHGFTGKTCQLRGDWDPCLSNPCGHFGSCIRLPHSATFICNCSHGYSGTACKDRITDLIADGWPLNAIKIIGLIIVILLLIIFVTLIMCIYLRIKKSRKSSKVREMEYETNNYNPRVSMSYEGVSHAVTPAPPLFPRLHSSNYEKGLPTVQVRPLPIHERISSSSIGGASRSPSLAGSNRCRIRWVAESGSIRNCGSERCIGSCDEIEPLASNEALRRYGEVIMGDDDEMASCSSSQLQLSVADRRRRSSGPRYKAGMKRTRNIRVSNEAQTKEDWRKQCEKRINEACDAAAELRGERLKSSTGISRNITNDSSPNIKDDDDYMTMRPVHRRIITQSSESQRRPLLETSDSDGMESADFSYPDEVKPSQRREPPPPPAHNIRRKNKKAIASSGDVPNRVYDEPAAIDVGNSDKKSSKIVKKTQSTSELVHSSERFEDFGNIDDSDDDRTVNTSTSSNVHQTMAVL
uniref:Cadherin domain-containing protein n=2 Tax=Wuchereria bancrofti TaxID=6293 RepID=A0AAF5PQC7_WUCBA